MRPSFRAYGLALIPLLLAACVEGQRLDLPPAAAGVQTRLLLENCDGDFRATVHLPSDPGSVLVQRCESSREFVVLDYLEPPERLGWTVGPLAFDSCASKPGECCYEASIPLPDTPGRFHRAVHDFGGNLGAWKPETRWPETYPELLFPRRCYCPRFGRRQELQAVGYSALRLGVISEEKLLLVGTRKIGDVTVSDVFETTLSALRADGLPLVPRHELLGFQAHSLDIDADGNFVIGNNLGPELVLGRYGGSLTHLVVPDPSARSTHFALSRASGSDVELIGMSEETAGRLYRYRAGAWEAPIFDGRSSMQGRCAPPVTLRQRAASLRISDREQVFMPTARGCLDDGRVCSATTAPDGFWHVVDGTPSWARVDKMEDSCLAGFGHSPEFGIIVLTRWPRILQHVSGAWRDLVAPELLGLGAADQEVRSVAAIPGGLLYTRQGGRLGAVVEGFVCPEVNLGFNRDLRFVHRVGDAVAIDTEPGQSDPTDARLYVFEVDWSENRLLE